MPYATVIKQMMTWDISEPIFERLYWFSDQFPCQSIVTVLLQAEPLNAVPSGLGGRWSTRRSFCQINKSRPLFRSTPIGRMTILSSNQPKSTPPLITQLAFWRNTLTVLHHPPCSVFFIHPVVKFLCPTLVCKTVGYFQRDEEHGRLWREELKAVSKSSNL